MGKHSSELFRASDYRHPRFWPMWLLFGLLRLLAMLPYPAATWFGRMAGRALLLVSGSRTSTIDTNLSRCFPHLAEAERDRIKRNCYQNLGISLTELAMCWWWSDERLRGLVEIRGREHLDKVLESGRGAILLTAHYTSLEIGGRLLTLFMPLQGMYRTQRNPMFDSFLYSRRSSYLVDIVSRKHTRRLLKGIRNQVPTWYAPDQDFRRERNVFAPFMNIPTATISASSRLAEAGNAAMLPYYPERKADGSGYILHIEAPIANFPSEDEIADAIAINLSIENWVRRFPDNYMWMLKRFKTRPPGEAPFYP